MDAGGLVSDAIVSALIAERLDSAGDAGIIFVGFPRTHDQAVALTVLLDERGRKIDHVIELAVNEEQLVERITGRFSCARCGTGYHDIFKRPRVEGVCDVCGSTEFKRRPDDNEQTVRRPITIALPMVSALNRLRSAGMCHGKPPWRPMTPL
jgi:adenylate kinase